MFMVQATGLKLVSKAKMFPSRVGSYPYLSILD